MTFNGDRCFGYGLVLEEANLLPTVPATLSKLDLAMFDLHFTYLTPFGMTMCLLRHGDANAGWVDLSIPAEAIAAVIFGGQTYDTDAWHWQLPDSDAA